MNIKSNIFLGLALSATLIAGVSQAAPRPSGPSYYGSSVASQAADRRIVIQPGTRWVNVNNGETVTFVVGEQNFTFHFETYPSTQALNLGAIAPSDINVGGVRVYVANDESDKR